MGRDTALSAARKCQAQHAAACRSSKAVTTFRSSRHGQNPCAALNSALAIALLTSQGPFHSFSCDDSAELEANWDNEGAQTRAVCHAQTAVVCHYPCALNPVSAPAMASITSQKVSTSSQEMTALSRKKTGMVRAPKQVPEAMRGCAVRPRLRRKYPRERLSSSCSSSMDSA